MTPEFKFVNMEPARKLVGEVRLHCMRCEADVDLMDKVCSACGLTLRKECPNCHYWGELDRAYCLSCKNSFPLPAPRKATIKRWYEG